MTAARTLLRCALLVSTCAALGCSAPPSGDDAGGGGAGGGGGGGALGGGAGGGAAGGGAGGGGGVDAGPPNDDPFLPDGGYSVEKVDGGFTFTEGPLWLASEGALLFTDIQGDTIWRYEPGAGFSVFRTPSANANGLGIYLQGRLLVCEHTGRRLARLLSDAGLETVADRWDGGRLNSPNDVIARSDGTLYFTDPPYGVPAGQSRELAFQGVFRVTPAGALELVADDMNRPNGVALSPDETVLYVSDTAASVVRRYDVNPDGTVSNPAPFAVTIQGGGGGGGDGLAMDDRGNLYVTTQGGVKVFRPDGGYRGAIQLPEEPANVSFGDADRQTLYITARTGLYRVRLRVPGLP